MSVPWASRFVKDNPFDRFHLTMPETMCSGKFFQIVALQGFLKVHYAM